MSYQLTKSKYIKGLQCEKAMYLKVYKKHLGKHSERTKYKFRSGHDFEGKFKSRFKNGIAVDEKFGKEVEQYVSYTKECYQKKEAITLFEAGFIDDEVLVLTDVLCKDEENKTTIYEVKSSKRLTDTIIADLSVQYYICQSQIENIESFKLVLNDGRGGFKIKEMINELRANMDKVSKHIAHFKQILKLEEEPEIEVGFQCDNPYECEFKDYCNKQKLEQEEKEEQVIVVNENNHSNSIDEVVDGIVLDKDNPEFNYALEFILETNTPLIYLTGKAGTGKTTFLKYLKAKTTKEYVVLAPTGVAAVNAGGQTIHSFFQIQPDLYVPGDARLQRKRNTGGSSIYDYFQYNKEKLTLIKKMDLLIIDEISMVRCDLLDVIDTLLRVFRNKLHLPFGGVQVILIGDTFQLPPITRKEDWDILKEHYKSSFFFHSKVIEQNKPIYIELKKIYRQKDQRFIDILNKIRTNDMEPKDYKILNTKYDPEFIPSNEENYIMLATTNRVANNYNSEKLEAIDNDVTTFDGVVNGDFSSKNFPVDETLELKEGAQVMFRKNNLPYYYNGTLGKIASIKDDKIIVEVEKNKSKQTIEVEKVTWENVKYTWNNKTNSIEEEILGTFTQYPIKLAWAITVHKSQGLTFEKVIADIGSSFTSGQVYVALSRCTSFDGLVLKSKIGSRSIKLDNQVVHFSKSETPQHLIPIKLNSGKADVYYLKAREAFKSKAYETGFDCLVKACHYRNDLETPIFKRYFLAIVNRLNSSNILSAKEILEKKCLIQENEALKKQLTENDSSSSAVLKALQNKYDTSLEKQKSGSQRRRELKSEIRQLNLSVDKLKESSKEKDNQLEISKAEFLSQKKAIKELQSKHLLELEKLKKANDNNNQVTNNTIKELKCLLKKYKNESLSLSNKVNNGEIQYQEQLFNLKSRIEDQSNLLRELKSKNFSLTQKLSYQTRKYDKESQSIERIMKYFWNLTCKYYSKIQLVSRYGKISNEEYQLKIKEFQENCKQQNDLLSPYNKGVDSLNKELYNERRHREDLEEQLNFFKKIHKPNSKLQNLEKMYEQKIQHLNDKYQSQSELMNDYRKRLNSMLTELNMIQRHRVDLEEELKRVNKITWFQKFWGKK